MYDVDTLYQNIATYDVCNDPTYYEICLPTIKEMDIGNARCNEYPGHRKHYEKISANKCFAIVSNILRQFFSSFQ